MTARNATKTKSAANAKAKAAPSPASSAGETAAGPASFRERLRRLYFGRSQTANRFRYALLAFDIVTILFIVGTSFAPRSQAIEWLDAIFGVVILADFLARLYASHHPLREFAHPATWADIIAIASFLAPVVGEGLGFLRILRTLRLLHTYQLAARLRTDSAFFRRNEELVIAVVNLAVFLFIMTGFVYETQHWRNPAIANYVDALYFTVTALTTTGFGDITLEGTSGRLLSIFILLVGVGLFLRLIQTIFRPPHTTYECPDCGLTRHDTDAIHCKHCGKTLHLVTEGEGD
jgi:voltage-gated potassium channel